MNEIANKAAEKAATSVWLAAAARLLTVLLTLVGVPLFLGLVGTVSDLDKQMAVQKLRDEQQDKNMKDITAAVASLKTTRDADTKAVAELAIAMGRALEKLDAHGRSLQRIEIFIDGRRPPAAP